MTEPSKKMVRQLAKRMLEIGIPLDDTDEVTDVMMGRLACGDGLLVVVRGPDLCKCCGKLMIRGRMLKKTRKPLEELFKV